MLKALSLLWRENSPQNDSRFYQALHHRLAPLQTN